ncbi:hypothetical protein V6N11_013816 [Hibiscus sabdariffa]|uniref:Uncharacterized protein n=1 Tax=Hibiscus sabdariffa TaxID=183260 RepID=A0ABR2PD14_9ROSI
MRTGTATPYRYDFSYWNLFKAYRTDTVAPVSEQAFRYRNMFFRTDTICISYRYDLKIVPIRILQRCRSALMAGLKLLNGHIDDLNNQNG